MPRYEVTMVEAVVPVVCYTLVRFEKPEGWDELSDAEKAVDAVSRLLEDDENARAVGEAVYSELDLDRVLEGEITYKLNPTRVRTISMPESRVHPGMSDLLRKYAHEPVLSGEILSKLLKDDKP